MIKRYDKGFRSDRKIAEGDEISIITARLIEIQEIRETGIVEAQRVCSKETEEIPAAREWRARLVYNSGGLWD